MNITRLVDLLQNFGVKQLLLHMESYNYRCTYTNVKSLTTEVM